MIVDNRVKLFNKDDAEAKPQASLQISGFVGLLDSPFNEQTKRHAAFWLVERAEELSGLKFKLEE